MFKKFVSLAIVLMLVMSMAAVAVSAAQVEISENAADTPAEVGAEGGAEVGAEGGADTGAEGGADTSASGKTVSFDPSACGWNNYTIIMLYCYCPADGSVQIDWAAKKKGGMTESNGIWTYDFDAKKIELEDGKEYSLIFNADTGVQTHDLLFNTTMYGDTAVGEATQVENPADSNKKSNIARWKSGKLGPALCITSLGNVVGEQVPSYTTAYKMFVGFLADTGKSGLQNALNYANGKSAQEVIDETASKLGLKKGDVTSAIAEAAKPDGDRVDSYDWSKDWSADKSSLSDGENQEAHQNPNSGVTDPGASGGSGSE
ncbi:MAG: hypothetical protein IJ639_05500, partial [Ruminococcus sp.]|nr:hypothetical protein [Ruminococcus sp.]